jgi:hypothetical protein
VTLSCVDCAALTAAERAQVTHTCMYAYAINFGKTLARTNALYAARWYTVAQAGCGDGATTTNAATANGGEAQVRPACDTAFSHRTLVYCGLVCIDAA